MVRLDFVAVCLLLCVGLTFGNPDYPGPRRILRSDAKAKKIRPRNRRRATGKGKGSSSSGSRDYIGGNQEGPRSKGKGYHTSAPTLAPTDEIESDNVGFSIPSNEDFATSNEDLPLDP